MSLWSTTHPTNARFFRVIGGLFFDFTAEAADAAPNDIFFGSVASASTGDYFVIGWTKPFENTVITVSQAFVGVSGFVWEYWDGSTWTALSDVIDGTSGLTAVGPGTVSWTVPGDWAQNTVDGTLAYHVRVLWSPWTSTVTAPKGTIISITGLAVDPVYGDNPFDPGLLWDQTIRPILSVDPEWVIWRNVWELVMLELAESQWLTRWRRAVTTAEGAQLDERAIEIGFLCPGWTDERCSTVLSAMFAASYVQPTTPIVEQLADALLDVGQSFFFAEEFPCSARFTYFETSPDDAVTYLASLARARARGCQYFLAAHPPGGGAPFIIDTSLVDGADTIGELQIGP